MVSLYHRKLLDDFELSDISTKIEDAMAYVAKETDLMGRPFKDALLSRLELRKMLLSAVQLNDSLDHQGARLWEGCLELLPKLSQTNKFGVPSENSFSIKIQRKLASSVPPRPIVKISFDEALRGLSSICQNGRDAYRILNSHSGSHLMVCSFRPLALDRDYSDLSLDICLGLPIPKATSIYLYTMLIAVTDFQRDEGTWNNVVEATSL